MDSETSKVEVELTATEKLAQFEKEKLSRRQALARIGFQAGAAAIAALTADDLLRKVGKEMQRRAGDNKVVEQVAKEFQQAGMANAVPPTVPVCPEEEAWNSEYGMCLGTSCETCQQTLDGMTGNDGGCMYLFPDPSQIDERHNCLKNAYTKWCKCMKNNNCPNKPNIPQCSNCTYQGC